MNASRVLLLCFCLSACASTNSLRTDLSSVPAQTGKEAEALTNNLLDAYKMADQHRIKLDTALNQTSINDFTDAGITLSDYLCDRFFRETNASARRRQFARGTVNDVGGIVSAVLGLASAGSGVTGGVAAGFSFLDSGFRNYDSSFLVDTDISKVRRLVIAAQDNMKQQIYTNRPNSVFSAQSTIIRYSSLCSFLGMQDLINSAISEKAARIENNTNPQRGTAVPAVASPDAGVPPIAPATPPVTPAASAPTAAILPAPAPPATQPVDPGAGAPAASPPPPVVPTPPSSTSTASAV